MQVIKERPPMYEKILQSGMSPSPTAIYTYGDKIYSPSGDDIPEDVLVHEEVHMKQQGDNPDFWWERFIGDPYFRIDQEVEAYAVQYNYICDFILKDRNQRFKCLWRMATLLGGPAYGNVISITSACGMIKQKALELKK